MKKPQKYLERGEGEHPDVGNFVHWYVLELNLKKRDISDAMNIIPTTLNQYFKNRSMQFGILWRLSQAMKFNLVMAIGEKLNIPFETKVEKELRAELAEKVARIKELEMEVGIYKRVVER